MIIGERMMKGKQFANITKSILLIVLCCVLFCGCLNAGQKNSASDTAADVLHDSKLSEEEKIEKILRSMSKTEKLGQLMMIGIGGKTADEDSLYQLHQFHFGGIVLFDRNMESLKQVRSLTDSLQKKCEEKLPLFIAVDEEGGEVVRMEEVLTPPPSQQSIGKTGDKKLANKWAADTAKRLKDIGINVNFAPVADIGSNGERHYSDEPKEVANFVAAAADGYEQERLYYSLKHFPGIGKGKTDSHIDSVVVNATKEELMAEDLLPFRRIIESRRNNNYIVMVSHIIYPEISGDTPASLSKEIMSDLLRKELKYDGVIATDDMEMGAVSNHYGFRELGVRAINAGADIVLVCHDYEHETEVYMGMLEALKKGRLSEERINESVRRVIKMKLKYLI